MPATHQPNEPSQVRARPVEEIQDGRHPRRHLAKQTESGVRHNVTFERIYRDDQEWRSTSSFGRDDLLLLAKVADQAHSWIHSQARESSAAANEGTGSTGGTSATEEPRIDPDGPPKPRQPRDAFLPFRQRPLKCTLGYTSTSQRTRPFLDGQRAWSIPLSHAGRGRLRRAQGRTNSRSTPRSGPRFDLGRIVITSNAASVLPNHEVIDALRRHVRGDWGTLGAEDWVANERALSEGSRLLSAYSSRCGIRFWIITEADRSVTTVLLPEDY